MDKLIAELQRLYRLPGQPWPGQNAGAGDAPTVPEEGPAPVTLDLVDPAGMTRALVVGFESARDWEAVARLYRGLQEELDLPAPAVAVSGKGGYQVWLSLAEPVPAEQARSFLDGLRRHYLAELPAVHLKLRPETAASVAAAAGPVELPPARHPATGKWSAFIDPSMGSMFVDEPGLDMAPTMDRQADLLAGFGSIAAGDFRRVLTTLQAQAKTDASPAAPSAKPLPEAGEPGPDIARPRSTLNVGSNFSDPKSFLLAVMNDPAATARQRIKAAKALLPYFAKAPRK